MSHSTRARYRLLSSTVFDLYAERRLTEALDLIRTAPRDLAPWQAELAFLEACLLGAAGQPKAALGVLQGALGRGGWWDPSILAGDDDLAEVRQVPGFSKLLDRCAMRWQHCHQEPDRGGDVHLRPVEQPRGLVVALHGAEEDARDAVDAWRPVLQHDWELLAVRSSHRTSPRYRTWANHVTAMDDISSALAALPATSVNGPIVATGFSAGGRVALTWALSKQPCPVSGVVAVAPAIDPEALPAVAAAPLEPAHLVVGDADDLHEPVVAAAHRLRRFGFTVEVVAGLGHQMTPTALRPLARPQAPSRPNLSAES